MFSKSTPRPTTSPRLLLPGFSWFLLLGWLLAANPALAKQRGGASFPVDRRAHFAVADFDGDLLPDLASVEVDQSGLSETRYSIEFSLSAGLQQILRLTGPVGGLQIAAADVNGDDFLDLLVRSAWQARPVAVLLNDGHGNFKVVPPADFPRFRWSSEVCQLLEEGPTFFAEFASLSRTRPEIERFGPAGVLKGAGIPLLLALRPRFSRHPAPAAQTGRAPPLLFP